MRDGTRWCDEQAGEATHVSLGGEIGALDVWARYLDKELDAPLMRRGLVDEFHLFLTPVAVGRGQHLFEDIDWAPGLRLAGVTRFASGVLSWVYLPA
jgi:hypothetical protein